MLTKKLKSNVCTYLMSLIQLQLKFIKQVSKPLFLEEGPKLKSLACSRDLNLLNLEL